MWTTTVAITLYKACDVDALALTGGDYPAGYSKGISLSNHTSGNGSAGWSVDLLRDTVDSHTYTVIEASML